MGKERKPVIAPEMHETIRREILSRLREGPVSAKELSAGVGIPEKEVAGHLEHIRKTIAQSGLRLIVTPAECRKCGFLFAKRERLTKPGKCPVCKSESIHEPLFAVEPHE